MIIVKKKSFDFLNSKKHNDKVDSTNVKRLGSVIILVIGQCDGVVLSINCIGNVLVWKLGKFTL